MPCGKRLFSTGIASLVFAATTASAYVPADNDISLDLEDSTGPAIVLDLVLVRPLGVVATLVGTAFFVVGLPFEAVTRDFATPRQYLIDDPAHFTFNRPLGDFGN